jgi:hypothetical protein
MKRQTRRASAIEAAANVVVGFALAFVVNATLLPTFGFSLSFGENLTMTTVFTGISLLRSYTLRRIFNSLS